MNDNRLSFFFKINRENCTLLDGMLFWILVQKSRDGMGVQYVNIVQCILSFLDIPSITRLTNTENYRPVWCKTHHDVTDIKTLTSVVKVSTYIITSIRVVPSDSAIMSVSIITRLYSMYIISNGIPNITARPIRLSLILAIMSVLIVTNLF